MELKSLTHFKNLLKVPDFYFLTILKPREQNLRKHYRFTILKLVCPKEHVIFILKIVTSALVQKEWSSSTASAGDGFSADTLS